MSELQINIESKSQSEIPNFTKHEIRLISYNPDSPPDIIGSYGYRMQKYPADVDLMDDVNTFKVHNKWHAATNPQQIIAGFTRRIKQIASDLKRYKGHYLLDFKAGIDSRYLFTLGYMEAGHLTIDADFMTNVKGRYEAGLYSEKEVDAIMKLVEVAPTDGQKAYDGLTKVLRSKYIQRWSLDEMIRGRKSLPLGKSLTMEEALDHHQIVKMDLAVDLDGKLTEMSNIWSLFYYDKIRKQYEHMTPVPNVNNIPFDTEKLYWSDAFYSPYKVIKRIYSYSRLKYFKGEPSYASYILKTIDVLKGDVSQLYQIKSELSTILDVHALYGHVSSDLVDHQIDGMKARLANNLQVSMPLLKLLDLAINKYLKHPMNTPEAHMAKMQILEEVKNTISKLVNDLAVRFLIDSGMNPPPPAMLPTAETARQLMEQGLANPFCPIQAKETYNWSIIRYPEEMKQVQPNHVDKVRDEYEAFEIAAREAESLARLKVKAIITEGRAMMSPYGGCLTCGGSDGVLNPKCPCCKGRRCRGMACGGSGIEWGDIVKSVADVAAPVLTKYVLDKLSLSSKPARKKRAQRIRKYKKLVRGRGIDERENAWGLGGLNEMSDIDFAIRADTGIGPGLLKGFFRGL